MPAHIDAAGLPLRSRSRLLAGASLLGLAAGGALLPVAAKAADTPTSATQSGAWSDLADWTNGAPTSTYATTVGGGFTITTDGANATDTLLVDQGSAVSIGDSTSLTIGSAITNNGVISINGNNYSTSLQIGGPTTLSGTGVIVLNGSGNSYIGGTGTLTNQGSTIQGGGQIGVGQIALDNKAGGLIDGNIAGATLTLNTISATNEGTLRASAGGALNIATNVTQSGAGALLSTGAGSVVNVTNSAITGGTLTSNGGGTLGTQGTSTLTNLTLTAGSTYTTSDSDRTYLVGSIVNNGTLAVNGNNYATELRIAGGTTTTLSGGGVIALGNSGNNLIRDFDQGTGKLVNVDNTIMGAGNIGAAQMAFDNQAKGLVDANLSSTLYLQSNGTVFTNEGLYRASAGGTLNIYNTTVTNGGAGALLSTGNNGSGIGSSVVVTNSTINSGTLTTGAGAFMGTAGTSTLNNVTLTTGSTYSTNDSTVTYLENAIVNNGTFAVNGNNYTTELRVAGGGATTLTGGGTIALDNNGNNTIRDANNATGTLTNVDNTIVGAGQLGNGQLGIDNQAKGVVNAIYATALNVQANGAGVSNEGLLEATVGGVLRLNDTTVNQSGAGTVLSTGTGSTAYVANSTINGGTLTTASGGAMASQGTSVLNGVKLTAGSTYSTNDGTVTYLENAIVNNGTFALNGNNYTTELRVAGGGATTLTGGGTIALDNSGNNIIRDANQATGKFTNVDNTIVGAGQLGDGQLAIDNQSKGVVNAIYDTALNVQGNSAGVSNEGLMEASGDGLLQVTSTTLNQSSTGTLLSTGAGANVNVVNSTVNGGTLTTAANGSMQTGGTSHLNNLTISAGSTYNTDDSSVTYLGGTIVNQGTLGLNGNNYTTELRIAAGTTTTLTGGGTVSLNNSENNVIRDADAATGTLVNQDNTIEGAGQFGNGQLGIVNNGAGSIVANQSNALNINTNGQGITNNGVLKATAGATLNVGASQLNNYAGGTLTGGIYEADANSTINLNTGPIVTDAALITLSGTGSAITTSGAVPIETTLTEVAAGGGLNIVNGRNYATLNDISDSGQILLGSDTGAFTVGGDTFAPNSVAVTSTGTLSGYGTVTPANGSQVANAGSVFSTNGGTLAVTTGISGAGGVGSATGSTLDLSAATKASSAGLFSVSGNVALGSQNILVSSDYHNFNFGAGNAFDAHANITGTGEILATGNVGISVTGADITGGASSPTLSLGNVHVAGGGSTSFVINNTGTSGPSIRGAVQNSGITNSGLIITAQNYGPIATGASSAAQDVTYTAGSAGAFSNQSFKVVTNFDNVAPLTVGVTGSAYDYANPTVTTPVNLGNFHVNAAPAQAGVAISNTTISNAAYQEGLDVAAGATTGSATTSGGPITLLAAGATDNSTIKVGLSGTTAGNESGTVALGLTSDGANTSHLGTTALPTQTVTVTGTGYNLASSNTIAPVNFGVLHTNTGVHTEALTVTNTAPTGAYSEGLDSSFGAYTNNGGLAVSSAGSITNLAAGSTNSGSLTLSVSTATAGMVSGSIAVHQDSNGTIDGLGNTALAEQNPAVSGTVEATVTNLASPQINNTQPINFGNVRIGTTVATQNVSVTNAAPSGGFSEGLIGNVTGATGTGITASGGFGSPGNSLAPQATNDTGISVGLDTSSGGAKSGNAEIDFKSDGTAFQGGTVTDLGNTNVAVTGNVYRLASPTLNTPSITLAARVGDTAPSAAVSVTNTSPDIYTEGLAASFGATPTGFATSGSVANLAAAATDAASLSVKLNTATSGTFGGTQVVNFTSTGVGTDNATDLALTPGDVTVAGHVYQAAVASVSPNPVAFGTVHVGDTGLSQTVTVGNTATGALTDTLTGGFGTVSGPFSGSGSLSVAAGSTGSLAVGLNTSKAGVYSSSGNLALSSHDSELTDVAVAASPVDLTATVNNYAKAGLGQVAGSGMLSTAATTYTLNFGSVKQGSGTLSDNLFAANTAVGPADLLSGMFTVASGSGDFGLTGTSFADLAAGSQFDGLDVSFNTASTGMFTETLNLQGVGSNDSGYIGTANIDPITLVIDGTVTPGGGGGGGGSNVPEPGGLAVLGMALLGLLGVRRRVG